MSNLDKWRKFLDRKRWKYKEVETKYGKRLMVKTYNKTMRCHIFISEDKLNFAFFRKGRAKSDINIIKRAQTNYCLSFRNGTLHIYTKSAMLGFRHLGADGPSDLLNHMRKLTEFNTHRRLLVDKPRIMRVSKNKFKYIMEFYLKLNGVFDGITEERNHNRLLLETSYPALKNLGTNIKSPGFMSKFLRNKDLDFDGLIKKVVKYNSKPIKKAFMKTSTDNLFIAHILRTRFNRGEMEKLILIFGTGPKKSMMSHNVSRRTFEPQLKYFFKQYSNKKIFKILSSAFDSKFRSSELVDSITQLWEFKDKIEAPQDFKDVKDLHDNISLQYKRLEQEDYDFDIPEKLKVIDGIKVDNSIIVLPKTRYELLEWGQKMNNCIASYHKEFHKGQTVLVGIKENNEIKYNVEIRRGVVVQFVGNRNRRAENDAVQKYIDVLEKHKLIKIGA